MAHPKQNKRSIKVSISLTPTDAQYLQGYADKWGITKSHAAFRLMRQGLALNIAPGASEEFHA